jgi:hypothetical protein
MNKLEIEKLKEYPLGNDDINALFKSLNIQPTNIFTTKELLNVNNIDELLDINGKAIMLYLTENETTGHWISILRKGNTIEVYDPYGNNPLNFEDNLYAKKGLNPNMNLLIELIKKSGYKIIYNKHKHQKMNPSVNTCGRLAVLRLLSSDLDLNDYNKIIKKITGNGINMDDIATGITYNIIGK